MSTPIQTFTDHLPVTAAGTASILTAATAPWWVPLIVQGVGLLLAYLNGRTAKAKQIQALPPAVTGPTSQAETEPQGEFPGVNAGQ